MSGASVADFMAYWAVEGEQYARHGDYEWMASLVPGRRVLEIGCGLGFGTEALLARELDVLAMDSLPVCLAATESRVASSRLQVLQAEVTTLDAAQRAIIEDFAPDVVVCWLMGAPAEVTGAQPGDGGRAVISYREKMHRTVAELAAALPPVTALHLVDRTAIAWQAKDIGRDTLVRYHTEKTLQGLPFVAERGNALYRKLSSTASGMGAMGKLPPAMRGAVPTLAALLVTRRE